VAESTQQVAGPPHVRHVDPMANKARFLAVVREFRKAASRAGDERLALKQIDVVALWPEMSALAEGASKVTHDVPAVGSAVQLYVVERVVGILEIPTVEDEEDDQQSFEGSRSHERILLPGPGALMMQRRIVEPEPASGLDMRLTGRVDHREGG